MVMHEQAYSSASELLRLMDRGELKSRELLERYLSRIEKFSKGINAVVFLYIEKARARAYQDDQARSEGRRWGALHGLPMTVKDVNHVAGWPTTYGDPRDAAWRPEISTSLVDRLIH